MEERRLAVFEEHYLEADSLEAGMATQYVLDTSCRGADHILATEAPVTFYLLFATERRIVEVDCLCRPTSLRVLSWPANLPDTIDAATTLFGGEWGIVWKGHCFVASSVKLGSVSSNLLLSCEVTVNQG